MPLRRRTGSTLAAGVALLALGGGTGRAEDLRGALTAAYATNPTLAAARDSLRATDEGVAIARADGLPDASGVAQETEYVRQNPANELFSSMPRAVTVTGTLNVPLYAGGAVKNAIRAADTRVNAGRADLAGTESSVFSQVVAAYLDVITNAAIVRLNQAQVQTLDVNLKATQDRFEIGDVTRTDVAQSQSRLALANGNLRGAEANLAGARETYIQLVGHAPRDLETPPPLPGMPKAVDDAVAYALDHNPDLAAAHQRSVAAGFDSRVARAANMPRIGLFADGGYTNALGTLTEVGVPSSQIMQGAATADVGIRATIPLYQGGRPTAQMRQAQAREGTAMDQEIGAERAVIANVRAAWVSWQAANAIIASTQIAVDSAQLSLEGVRAENSVGNRTILDILNAEQELVNAEVQLVTAQRNAYVAGFTLLAAMGRAQARDLGLDGGTLYDPTVHYKAMRASLSDWGRGEPATPSATRTVDTAAQSGTITKP